MIRINLLAVERERARRRATFEIGPKVTIASSLILLATAVVIVWWYWSLSQTSARLDEDIANAQRETQRLHNVLQQVKNFETQRAQLQQRVQLIEQLRRGQSGPVHLLDEISRSLPDRLWLTDLKQGPAGEVTLEGRSTSLASVSDFVTRLEGSGYFKRPVEIVDSQVQQEQGVDLVKFSIKATFSPPAG